MWVCASISPGSTVAPDRSITRAPSGTRADPPVSTLSMRFPRTTMTTPRLGALDFPSISVPARIATTALSALGAGVCAAARPAASRAIQFASRPGMRMNDLLSGGFSGDPTGRPAP